MGIQLQYNVYYTHFSLLLFIISFALPFSSKFKFFILLNSIIVGIAGNLIMLRDYTLWVNWYQTKNPDADMTTMNLELQVSNFATHTCPMIIAFILLPFCTSYLTSTSDAIYWFIIEVVSILLWSLLPNGNLITQHKIEDTYPNTQFLLNSLIFGCFFVFGLMVFLKRNMRTIT